ncbi:pyruvate/2-oxoglutarate dehydrogenase complex, dihydrolipoamide acyltransferase component [Mycobacterium sp. JS623]|uniref:biotin/lipoyl-containing protein n=1 Tax=Mycobacterium sp. JS623 TaxID=212767 RepID=UPI0002A588C7|nr:lipoyl domain-containing protein [Mycobacterium sp. JS623]AGB25429.1 pyruvate/2-oxoglutarate dehydrogenase complex, dihydrolipoamide acyltransferase component [Mycobacterium sp. JS623]
MAVTVDQLAAAVHQFFVAKLPGPLGDTPGSALLVFDTFGAPLSPADFGVGAAPAQQQLIAHQRAAQLADQLPAANGLANGWYQSQTGARLSRWYHTVVGESVCTSTSVQDIATFEKRKAAALEQLDLNQLVEVGGVTPAGGSVDPTGVQATFYATSMAPSDWFEPQAAGWETHHITAQDSATTPTGPLPVPEIHLRTATPSANAPAPGEGPPPTAFTMPPIADSNTPATVTAWLKKLGDQVQAGDPIVEVATDKVDTELQSPATGTVLDIAAKEGDVVPTGALLALIGSGRPVSPPTTTGFDVTFEYCVVSFDRPWWDAVFLTTPTWSVSGFAKAQIASGSAASPALAVPAITTGMVVVRNLSIAANWTDRDQLALADGAVSLGPFSTLGAAFDGQTLSRPGMQALAWICQVPPVMPPA